MAYTGQIVNIEDAYKDSRFDSSADSKTGFKTRSVLCMPMKNRKDEVIGVFQVLNKEEGVFAKEDEEMLTLLSGQAAAALESAILYEELKKTFVSFIKTLSETIDARDPVTAGHSRRVSGYSVKIGRKLNYSPKKVEVLEYAALVHDLGKIGVREEVLTKPGKLSREEYLHIQSHARKTHRILENIYFQPEYSQIPPAASLHHENIDGSGYPLKKKADEIPEMARIIAVADVFDSLSYKRHYRVPKAFEDVVDLIRKGSGTKFDPRIAGAFLNIKAADILKIITGGPEDPRPEKEELMELEEITAGEMADLIRKDPDSDKAVLFKKYYPAAEENEN